MIHLPWFPAANLVVYSFSVPSTETPDLDLLFAKRLLASVAICVSLQPATTLTLVSSALILFYHIILTVKSDGWVWGRIGAAAGGSAVAFVGRSYSSGAVAAALALLDIFHVYIYRKRV